MTDQTPETQRAAQPATQVVPAADSRLEQLHAQYPDLKAAADAATKALADCTTAIKAELTQAAPGETRVELVSPHGPRLQLSYVERHSFDSKAFKLADPATYVQYAKFSGSWRLEAAKADS